MINSLELRGLSDSVGSTTSQASFAVFSAFFFFFFKASSKKAVP